MALIDTENGSGDLYAHLGDYDVCAVEAPYTVKKYLDAIEGAERAGYDVVIVDSLSHAWAGEGGLLDQQGRIVDSSASKNSYTAWRTITPLHYRLVEAMLTSKCHIIATMRAKTEYAQEKDENGKTIIKKVGMAPVQREGMDYEFTLVFDLDINHNASASKDRTGLFDGRFFSPTLHTGEDLKAWLESGVEVPVTTTQETPETPSAQKPLTLPKSNGKAAQKQAVYTGYLELFGGNSEQAMSTILQITEGRGSKVWTDDDLAHLKADLKQRKKECTSQSPEGADKESGLSASSDTIQNAQGF